MERAVMSAWVSQEMPQANGAKTIAWAQNVARHPSGTATSFVERRARGESRLRQTTEVEESHLKVGGSPLCQLNPAPAGEWHFYAYTYDGKTHKLFGGWEFQRSSTTPPQTGPFKALEFGRYRRTYFSGMLDESEYTQELLLRANQAYVFNSSARK